MLNYQCNRRLTWSPKSTNSSNQKLRRELVRGSAFSRYVQFETSPEQQELRPTIYGPHRDAEWELNGTKLTETDSVRPYLNLGVIWRM